MRSDLSLVSVVIPAFNAEATLGETLASLVSQSYSAWEAVVVNDGSTDGTGRLLADFAEHDRRVRIVEQPQSGEGAARNAGISSARGDWVLFLDADDWILPSMLQRMIGAVTSKRGWEAIHCGWQRVTPDGATLPDEYCARQGDLFSLFADHNPLAVHACVLRRSLVERAGGFDPELRTCADWDFWQRVARATSHFGRLEESLVRYRMRPGSASGDPLRLLRDGLKVIALVHSADARVRQPVRQWKEGLPSQGHPGARYTWACWPAGLLLGAGRDARPLLEEAECGVAIDLVPEQIAERLFRAVPLAHAAGWEAWSELWSVVEPNLWPFLDELEARSKTSALARRTGRVLERLILDRCELTRPRLLGAAFAITVGASDLAADIAAPGPAEYAHCLIGVGAGQRKAEIPIRGGRATAADLLKAGGLVGTHPPETPLTDSAASGSGQRAPIRRGARELVGLVRPLARKVVSSHPALGKVAHRVLRQLPPPLVTAVTQSRGVPILMYHRVAPGGAPGSARYRVAPDVFAQHLQRLKQAGYRSVRLGEWSAAVGSGTPLRGRAVCLTFDDGYRDFADHAWPLLRRFGFTASVFIVTDCVGGTNRWDSMSGEQVPLMGWDEIRSLQREGVEIGSHSVTHRPLTSLTYPEMADEFIYSREALEDQLGAGTFPFAYPYGDCNPLVEYAASDCGYRTGVTCRYGVSTLDDRTISLRRMEITGFDTAEVFAEKLGL